MQGSDTAERFHDKEQTDSINKGWDMGQTIIDSKECESLKIMTAVYVNERGLNWGICEEQYYKTMGSVPTGLIIITHTII